MIPYKQLSLNEVFKNCEEKLENNKPAFLDMLGSAVDFDRFIAPSFYLHFYTGIGRSRKYPLEGFLWAMLIQRIFSIPTVSLLILFLKYSHELRETSKSHLRCGIPTMKFVCPKMKWGKKDGKYQRICFCENPCTNSSCGRMFYIYPEKNLRAYPGTVRDSQEWISTYKIRAVVEKSINHFKDCFCLEDLKTRNEKTIHADLLFAGIAQLITVLVADKIHSHQFIRSLKPLAA